jgi:hypothetical protein
LCCFKRMLGLTYPGMQCCIPEDWNPPRWSHLCHKKEHASTLEKWINYKWWCYLINSAFL